MCRARTPPATGEHRLHDLHQGHGRPHDLGPDGKPQPDQHGACHLRHGERCHDGHSNVIAAEYFIDTAGTNGAGIALVRQLRQSTVSVSGTLTAAAFSGLTQGTHTIYVQGEDAAGNWSPLVSTTFVKDTVAPTLSGLTVTPNPTNIAPSIAATISDAHRNANIVAADYFIDTTGANGAGTALSGAFGSPTVGVSGTLPAARSAARARARTRSMCRARTPPATGERSSPRPSSKTCSAPRHRA